MHPTPYFLSIAFFDRRRAKRETECRKSRPTNDTPSIVLQRNAEARAFVCAISATATIGNSKALACMHRHDAHEIAALRRKRPGASFAVSICAMKDCAIEATRTGAPSFSNDSTIRIGFHDVARNRLSLRAEAFKARKPARFFDRLRHDARYGHRPDYAGERFFTTPTA